MESPMPKRSVAVNILRTGALAVSLGLAAFFVQASHRRANPTAPALAPASSPESGPTEGVESNGSAPLTSDAAANTAAGNPPRTFLMDSKYAATNPLPFNVTDADWQAASETFLMSSKSAVTIDLPSSITPEKSSAPVDPQFLSSSKSFVIKAAPQSLLNKQPFLYSSKSLGSTSSGFLSDDDLNANFTQEATDESKSNAKVESKPVAGTASEAKSAAESTPKK